MGLASGIFDGINIYPRACENIKLKRHLDEVTTCRRWSSKYRRAQLIALPTVNTTLLEKMAKVGKCDIYTSRLNSQFRENREKRAYRR